MLNGKIADVRHKPLKFCLGLAVVFIAEELVLPVNLSGVMSYHMSVTDYRLLSILVNLPLILVWFVAFWGYSRLNSYARVMNGTAEAPGYRMLAKGLAWLAWVLPITSIVDRFLSALSNHQPKLHNAMTIINNYFNLILPLIAFIIIFIAAKLLVASQDGGANQPKPPVIMSIFLVIGALYCYLILKTVNFHSLSSANNIYYLPVWLLLISLVLPYLYGWFIGLLASYGLGLFGLNASGILYKRALLYLTSGLVAIILSFIVSQYLSAVWPPKFHLVFNYRLIITIAFRVIGGLGFVCLAIGASKLKMIEEV